MVYNLGFQNINNNSNITSFGHGKIGNKKSKCENHDRLLYEENKKHPILTSAKIQTDKLVKACTKYPVKGFKGSKNANFYEFLTMGAVPYLTGSAMIIATFNAASKFFDTPAAQSASKLGKKMGLGVLFYGLGKTLSKKMIETPVKMKYGIDVNLPYKKKIDELPEESNKDNLVAYEYHKAYESVDFSRWDLFYDNEAYGEERNSYFKKIGKKMGLKDEELAVSADQKVKPLITDKVVRTKLFSTLSSYLWAATGVGIAIQKPWENMTFNPVEIVKSFKNNSKVLQQNEFAAKNNWFKDFGKKFGESCKEFVNNQSKSTRVAGRLLLGSAVAMTLLGNFSTLKNFNNKGKDSQAASSLIDNSKEKVVC